MQSKWMASVLALAMALVIAGCADGASGGINESASVPHQTETQAVQSLEEPMESSATSTREEAAENKAGALRLFIDGTEVAVEWEDSESVAALAGLAADGPLAIQMSMYGGFEQVGSLETTLPSDDAQTTTGAGDIVLYSGDHIVVFYGSNSWPYTRLGHITDCKDDELAELLGNGDVALTITAE